ncbi:PD-(D/E)XK motif protein [Streptomyces sp. TLI_105]|uniref:PD-(D/E)XK motif protein n=1 Tax=Streptomyces sp. TLI_105 TaxID=1881019 RepID=UPI0008973062|nr:PD-(D/E)XK motif protein [Streptomyces sp. TLI_105]SED29694.1 Putative PD-(D/E)XK family member [Streptomyces sp. TLI_105]
MTDSEAGPALAWSTVEHYLGEGLGASYRLSLADRHPVVSYEIGHGGRDIALFVELGRNQRPPRSSLPAVHIDQVAVDGGLRMARIRTTQVELMRDFHDMVIAVADRIVMQNRSLDHAFHETVEGWSSLLDRPRAMSVERRVGLLGELSILNRLAETYGWDAAVEAWTGPYGEEHDFALVDFDIEVKTTVLERRRHVVHGIGQLQPATDRPLWFTSLRLTRGGAGGRTLAESVHAVRDAVAEHSPAALTRLDSALERCGWSPRRDDDERWTPRDEALVLAAEAVPRLTPELIAAASLERISAIRYETDVTGLDPTPGAPIDLSGLRLP